MSCLQDSLKQAYLDGELAAAVAALKADDLVFAAEQFVIDKGEGTNECDTLIVLTHGAGANMHHEFMQTMANGLVASNVVVARFNFPYMRANALDGKRRPPDRAPKLIADYALQLSVLSKQFQPKRIFLVGKSMGGRMSAILSETMPVDGVICLGYPFIPLSGGEPRLEPIERCAAPVMIIQGERDKFGHKGLVETWPAMDKVQLHWLTDGDHSFKPRKSSGATLTSNLEQAIAVAKQFMGI